MVATSLWAALSNVALSSFMVDGCITIHQDFITLFSREAMKLAPRMATAAIGHLDISSPTEKRVMPPSR
jgi:hypothetical protein